MSSADGCLGGLRSISAWVFSKRITIEPDAGNLPLKGLLLIPAPLSATVIPPGEALADLWFDHVVRPTWFQWKCTSGLVGYRANRIQGREAHCEIKIRQTVVMAGRASEARRFSPSASIANFRAVESAVLSIIFN